MRMRIGVDLGGTKIEALAMDEQGVERGRIRLSTPSETTAGHCASPLLAPLAEIPVHRR